MNGLSIMNLVTANTPVKSTPNTSCKHTFRILGVKSCGRTVEAPISLEISNLIIGDKIFTDQKYKHKVKLKRKQKIHFFLIPWELVPVKWKTYMFFLGDNRKIKI